MNAQIFKDIFNIKFNVARVISLNIIHLMMEIMILSLINTT